MDKTGPIVIIEDDADDQHLLNLVFDELGYSNDVIFFVDGPEAIEYLLLDEIKPFLIISDINLPKVNGLELRDMVQANEKLRDKCVPFIFFTTSSSREVIKDAYARSVQGFFVKPQSMEDLKRNISAILEYWKWGYTLNKF